MDCAISVVESSPPETSTIFFPVARSCLLPPTRDELSLVQWWVLRGLRQPDDRRLAQAVLTDVDLDLAEHRVDADQDEAVDLGQHPGGKCTAGRARAAKSARSTTSDGREASRHLAHPFAEQAPDKHVHGVGTRPRYYLKRRDLRHRESLLFLR
jgi:hypothetical protein